MLERLISYHCTMKLHRHNNPSQKQHVGFYGEQFLLGFQVKNLDLYVVFHLLASRLYSLTRKHSLHIYGVHSRLDHEVMTLKQANDDGVDCKYSFKLPCF